MTIGFTNRAWRRVAITLLLIGMTLPALGQTPTSSSAAAPAAAPQHGGGGFALLLLDYRVALERLTEDLREGTAQLAHGADMAPAEIMGAVHRATEGADPVTLVGGLLAILATGLAARHFVRRRLSGERLNGLSRVEDGFGARLGRALYRTLIDLLGLGAFAFVAIALVAIFVPTPGPVRTFLLTYVTAALVTFGAALVAHLLLAPDAPAVRLLPVSDRAAGFLHRWLVTIAAVGSIGWLTAALVILSGMQLQAHLMLALAIGTLMALLLIGMILEGRSLVAAVLLGEQPEQASALRMRLAGSWHVFGILYLVIIWALWGCEHRDPQPVRHLVGRGERAPRGGSAGDRQGIRQRPRPDAGH